MIPNKLEYTFFWTPGTYTARRFNLTATLFGDMPQADILVSSKYLRIHSMYRHPI